MMDKIKAFWGSVKDVLMYIIAPIAFCVGYIFYLTAKNDELKDELETAHFTTKDEELAHEETSIDQSAAAAIAEFNSVASGAVPGRDPGGKGGNWLTGLSRVLL